MENLYSTIFIVDISQNPDESETVTSRIQQLVEDHGGIIKKINRWGKRRLAYPVMKRSHGFYVEIEFSANSRLNIIKILEGEFRINDRVLRHMSYVIDKMELVQREKNAGKIRAAEGAEAARRQAAEKLASGELPTPVVASEEPAPEANQTLSDPVADQADNEVEKEK